MCFTESLRREPARPTPRYKPVVVYTAMGDQLTRDVQRSGGDRASDEDRLDTGRASDDGRLDTGRASDESQLGIPHPTSNKSRMDTPQPESQPLTNGPASRAVRSGKFYTWAS